MSYIIHKNIQREGLGESPYVEDFEGSFWASLVKITVAKDGFSKSLFKLRVH